MAASFCFTSGSASGTRATQPSTSERSTVSTVIPDRSRSFSLNRTVLKAAGRAPIAPIRACRSARTTRQVAANRRRSRSKRRTRRRNGVQRRERVLQAVLPQVVADRHLAAEAVAPVRDRHPLAGVGEGVHEHRHVEAGPAQRVGHGSLVAEVRQRHEHAIDAIGMRAKQVGAGARVGQTLDGAERARLDRQRHGVDAFGLERGQHVGAPGRAEM